jgi:hypothetical protein
MLLKSQLTRARLCSNWRAGVLMFFGFIGGVLTAIFGRCLSDIHTGVHEFWNGASECVTHNDLHLSVVVDAITSGLDICTFSVLTLLFRVSEKTATPTTVVLQAWNCTVGMLAKFILMDGTHGTHGTHHRTRVRTHAGITTQARVH